MADDSVEALKRRRGGFRAGVTRQLINAKTIIDEYDESRSGDLISIRSVLIEKIDILKDLDEKILDLLSLDETVDVRDIEAEVASAMEFTVNINKTLFKINEKLVKKEELPEVPNNEIDDRDENRSNFSGSGSRRLSIASAGGIRRIKLPKIELQKFSGDPKKFTAWWDSFDSVIHQNELNDVDKFQYLRSLLAGEALNAITGLPPTSENYSHAIDILKSRFGKKDVMITSHMDEILKINAISEGGGTRK